MYIMLYLCLMLMGLRGGDGCVSVFRCCSVWVALELPCLQTLRSLELEGSREDILYDENIIENIIENNN